MYGWEGGTENVACGGTRLKNALAGVPDVGASSNPKCASAMQTTDLTVAGAASKPAREPHPVRWEQVSEAWMEASTYSYPGLSSQNWLQEALIDRDPSLRAVRPG